MVPLTSYWSTGRNRCQSVFLNAVSQCHHHFIGCPVGELSHRVLHRQSTSYKNRSHIWQLGFCHQSRPPLQHQGACSYHNYVELEFWPVLGKTSGKHSLYSEGDTDTLIGERYHPGAESLPRNVHSSRLPDPAISFNADVRPWLGRVGLQIHCRATTNGKRCKPDS